MISPLLFLRVGWMDRYEGVAAGDSITGGGAYIAEDGFGHEVFNFKPFNGVVYGYAQPPGRKNQWEKARIDLTRIGADRRAESLSGVTVIWVSTTPQGGAVIVGWYNHATVYRNWQSPPAGSGRLVKSQECGFFVSA